MGAELGAEMQRVNRDGQTIHVRPSSCAATRSSAHHV